MDSEAIVADTVRAGRPDHSFTVDEGVSAARPFRVAQVIPQSVHPYSGLLVSVCRLAASLRAEGWEVELWQFGNLARDGEPPVMAAEEAGVTRVRFPKVGFGKGRSDLRQALASRDVGIAHLHGVFNFANVRVASLLRVPYVASPHGGYALGSLEYHRYRKTAFRSLFELPMLRGARAIGALTDREALELREFGVTGEVEVIPNGVDPAPEEIDTQAFRREYDIPEGARLATYVGRIDVRAKRLDAALRGIAAAPGWYLAVVGGDFRNGIGTLYRMVRDLGVADRTRIVPPRRGRALHEVLAATDVFLLLSRSEGMPMALLEAAAWGVPAIVSDEVDRALGLVEAGAGWRVEPERLASGLAAVDADHERRTRQRKAARAYSSRFQWKSVARAYGRLYERVLTTETGMSPSSR